MDFPIVIQLDETEKVLHDSLCWDLEVLSRMEYEERVEQLGMMGQLAESLIRRKAVPKARLDYFIAPEMNVGGHGKSRKEVFEKNGTPGLEILRHPHFMAYLRYFIYGPDLPETTIRGFCQIVEEDAGTSGMLLDQVKSYVRKEVRDRGLSPSHAAEEFFKLANEIGRSDLAENIRSAAKRVRA